MLSVRYWEAVLELLWPRFELILEMNISSIRNTDPQKLGVLDTRPHYVCTHMLCVTQRTPLTQLCLGQRAEVVFDFRSLGVTRSFLQPSSASTRRSRTRGPTLCWDSCRWRTHADTHTHSGSQTEFVSKDFVQKCECLFSRLR